MARFLRKFHETSDLPCAFKSIKFTLPYDGIMKPGVPQLNGGNVMDPLASVDPKDESPEEKEKSAFEAAAEILECQLILFGGLRDIPFKEIIAMYMFLFSISKAVERIQIPKDWEKDFVLGDRFLKVDPNYIEILGKKRRLGFWRAMA